MATMKLGGVSAEELVWKRYRVWAKTARTLKATHERSYGWVSVLSILGAIAGIIAQQVVKPEDPVPDAVKLNQWVAGMSALCVAVSTYLASQLLGVERETRWVKARGIAEAIKSQLYLFWMGVEPYQKSAAGPATPEQRLLEKVQKLEKAGAGPDREQLTEAELKASPAKATRTIDEYITLRIEEQINKFYKPKAMAHLNKVRRYRVVGIVLGLIGTLLGVFGATESGAQMVAWVAVVSTAAMGLTSFATAGRHQYLVSTYQAAAERLEYLLAVWSSSKKTPEDERRLVLDTEAMFRAENSAWIAEASTRVAAPEEKKPES
ncbi:DUF4231 domain-containing protein [Archangium gephyra]|uniref:DUF4231 domain-containing protein n=1 Tax=Archangium gephyra TaxID=48 RepID=UPI003B7742B7